MKSEKDFVINNHRCKLEVVVEKHGVYLESAPCSMIDVADVIILIVYLNKLFNLNMVK